jgi:hypothetical protein
MKWVRFKQEFDDKGTLYKYGKSEGLKKVSKVVIPGTKMEVGDSNIWVSDQPNPIIDNCFRIYTDPASLEEVLDKGARSNNYPEKYHPWIYHGEDYDKLPKAYFNKEYFKLNLIYDNKDIYCVNSEEQKKAVINLPNNKNREFKDKYFGLNHPFEIFIGGWVHFYDEEVRHGETDHAIYFDWDLTENKESVTIYILQTKPISGWNVYVKVNPPSLQDPPPPKNPPPPCAQPS